MRRLIGSVVMLFIVMSAVFVADRNIGDPARMILGDTGTAEDVLELRIRIAYSGANWTPTPEQSGQ